MVQCVSCGGRFEPIQTDGTQYFHRCPPLSRAELQAAVDAGAVVLPATETVDDAIVARTYERANLRDENLPSTNARDSGKRKADGAGVVDIAAAPPVVVVVSVAAAVDRRVAR